MSINDNIAQNLNNFMKEKNISANTIAKVGSVTPSTITRFISREIKSLNIETIQKIAAYYNEPMDRFIQELKNISNNSAEIITGSDIAYISFYRDIGVSAGHGLDWDSDGQILSFPIPLSFLHSKGIAPENALIVKVNGDSMTPTLNDNDLVVIDRNFSLSLNGIYVIKDNINGLRVKRLDKDKDGNLKVISDNKNYETQVYSVAEMQDEIIIILGKDFGQDKGLFELFFKEYGEDISQDLPRYEQYERGRNILYVAVTRAIKNLRILYIDDLEEIRHNIEKIFGKAEAFPIQMT